MGQQLQVRVPMRADGPARESGGVGKRIVELRGNPGASLPTVPVFGEKKPFLPRPARERASVGTDGRRIRRGATDAPRFRRSTALVLPTVANSRAGPRLPLLEHLVNAYQVQGGIGLCLLLRGLGARHLGKQIALVSVVAGQQAAAVLQGGQGLRLV